ncbi:hypothetical protein J6590_100740 [Homalodisca vitripennis]|nr:hypothetical protein J6590_100740 [Homalodisca vitripennis]
MWSHFEELAKSKRCAACALIRRLPSGCQGSASCQCSEQTKGFQKKRTALCWNDSRCLLGVEASWLYHTGLGCKRAVWWRWKAVKSGEEVKQEIRKPPNSKIYREPPVQHPRYLVDVDHRSLSHWIFKISRRIATLGSGAEPSREDQALIRSHSEELAESKRCGACASISSPTFGMPRERIMTVFRTNQEVLDRKEQHCVVMIRDVSWE